MPLPWRVGWGVWVSLVPSAMLSPITMAARTAPVARPSSATPPMTLMPVAPVLGGAIPVLICLVVVDVNCASAGGASR